MNLQLPVTLEYLAPALKELPDAVLYYEAADEYAAALGTDTIAKLARLYEQIAERGDDVTISHYIYGVNASVHDPNYRALKNLQLVFASLAKRGLAPFNSNRVMIRKPPFGKPRWDLLPAELRYLGPYAEKYGVWHSHEDIQTALAKLTDAERQELMELGKRFAVDWRKLRQWWKEILLQDLQMMTEAGGHPGEAVGIAEQEVDLTTGLQVFLLKGGFVIPLKRKVGIGVQKLTEPPGRSEAPQEEQRGPN
ncbi:hypothetical protein [Fontivita pretiosa]|uniref:hypothetical protein n=1 Tax=Fontivita pretiosa TaxID=2989684 RepID=UPI003D186F70